MKSERQQPLTSLEQICRRQFNEAHRIMWYTGRFAVKPVVGLNGMVETIALETLMPPAFHPRRFIMMGPTLDYSPAIELPHAEQGEITDCRYIVLALPRTPQGPVNFTEVQQADLAGAECFVLRPEVRGWERVGESVEGSWGMSSLTRHLQQANVVPDMPNHLVIGQ